MPSATRAWHDLRDVAHGPARGARREGRVGLERERDRAVAVGLPGGRALGVHLLAARRQRRVVDDDVDLAVGDVDADLVALLDEADGAALARLGRHVPDAQARRPARETAVGDERAGL